MERFYKRKAPEPDSGDNARNSCLDDVNREEETIYDPGWLTKQIDDYHPNLRERLRRKYLENGPCQPLTCRFSVIEIGGGPRRFIPEWFNEFGGWLEYSESKDRAYCFCYFLFRHKKDGGYEAFVKMVGMVIIERKGWEIMLLIGYFKSLMAASMRRAQNCLFALLLLVQETHFMISI